MIAMPNETKEQIRDAKDLERYVHKAFVSVFGKAELAVHCTKNMVQSASSLEGQKQWADDQEPTWCSEGRPHREYPQPEQKYVNKYNIVAHVNTVGYVFIKFFPEAFTKQRCEYSIECKLSEDLMLNEKALDSIHQKISKLVESPDVSYDPHHSPQRVRVHSQTAIKPTVLKIAEVMNNVVQTVKKHNVARETDLDALLAEHKKSKQ